MTAKPNVKPRTRFRKTAAQIKRVYVPASADDGYRILVDRLWPRGVSKEKAKVDLWLKDVSPSDGLRRQFHGHPDKWAHFVAAYEKELAAEPAKSAVKLLREKLREGPVTLLYAAHDEEHNNAVALESYLKS